MTADPMDTPPKDHGSDRYGHIEVTYPEGKEPPPQVIIDQALRTQCPDCNVNLFIQHAPDEPSGWQLIIAHDATCPWLTKHEGS